MDELLQELETCNQKLDHALSEGREQLNHLQIVVADIEESLQQSLSNARRQPNGQPKTTTHLSIALSENRAYKLAYERCIGLLKSLIDASSSEIETAPEMAEDSE